MIHGPSITYDHFPSPRQVTLLAFDMLTALKYLHTNDIVHGNIKPSNIFLVRPPSPSPLFKLADFGLATEGDGIPKQRPDDYTAPEIHPRAVGKNLSARRLYTAKADVWSLGTVLLEMVAGERPRDWWNAKNDHEERVRRKREAVADEIPAVLRRVLEGMLQPRPRRRTADQLLDDLPRRSGI